MSKVICKLITGETIVTTVIPKEDGGVTLKNPLIPHIQRVQPTPEELKENPELQGGVTVSMVPLDTVFFFVKEGHSNIDIEDVSNIVWQSPLSNFLKIEEAYDKLVEKIEKETK
jgi:hypothetical protein